MNSSLPVTTSKEMLFEEEASVQSGFCCPESRQRFAFGQIYPQGCALRHPGIDASVMQSECLIQARTECPQLRASVRFLHPMVRIVGSLSARTNELGGGPAQSFQSLRELTVEGRQFEAGQESVQREIRPPPMPLNLRVPTQASFPFRFYASREFEPIRDRKQQIAGVILRRQEGLEGVVVMTVEPCGPQLFKFTVRLLNRTPIEVTEAKDHDAVFLRTFISAQAFVGAVGAEFVPAFEPGVVLKV